MDVVAANLNEIMMYKERKQGFIVGGEVHAYVEKEIERSRLF